MGKLLLAANTTWYIYNYRLSLAQAAREAGYQVVVVSPPDEYSASITQAGFEYVPWRVDRQSLNPLGEWTAYRNLRRILQAQKPDLLHLFTIKPVLYGTQAAKALGLPAVVNSIPGRGYVFLSGEWKARLLRPLARQAYRLALRHPNVGLTFENHYDRDYFLHHRMARPERSWTLPGGGVDIDHFTPLPEPAGTPVIVLSGRLLWDKGVGTLVEAARRLRQRVHARVALVGMPDPGNPSSVDEDTLEGWVKEGIIEWWGWCDDMRQAYAESHIVTLPTSYGEGLPRALLEAAACARPIVASDIPACREIVEDGRNGLLVPPDDPIALAEALEKLVCDPALRRAMGAHGRQRVVERFADQLVNQAMLEIYHLLLDSRSKV